MCIRDSAVAGLGTALTEEQAHLLSSYAGEIFICYDADDAGQKATRKAINILGKTTLKVRIIHMTGGKDPDEIIPVSYTHLFRLTLQPRGF